MYRLYFLLVLTPIMILGCSSKNKDKTENELDIPNIIPAKYDTLKNVLSFIIDETPPYTISLIKEAEYGDSEEVIFGDINKFAVDSYGRIYIANGRKIEVFDANGTYLKTLGREGRGPGEFNNMEYLSPKIFSNLLYVQDDVLNRVNVFNTDSLSFIYSIPIRSKDASRKIAKVIDIDVLSMINDSLFFISLRQAYQEAEHGGFQNYFMMNRRGEFVSDKVFSYKEHPNNSYLVLPSFNAKPVFTSSRSVFDSYMKIAFDRNHNIYTSSDEDFLIKVYSVTGKFMRAIYYPYSRSTFDEKKIENIRAYGGSTFGKTRKQDFDIPEKWPAIHQFFLDDEDRIWVSTIIDDDENYEWWVLENNGQLISKFKWPGKRLKRNSMFSGNHIPIVKDGFFYITESSKADGTSKLIKYKIEFKKN